MSRIRTIKPEFFKHFDLYQAEVETKLPLRLAYAGLWTSCDREGRFKWKPEELKIDSLPYDNVDFSRVIDALWTRGFIEKYTSEGKFYGFVPSWEEHQHINNRELKSILPNPYESEILTRDGRVNDAIQGERKGKERKGKEVASPTQDEIKIYFKENGYSESSAIKMFNYYSVANWNDSNGNKVKNWKQKAQSVWFKKENELKSELNFTGPTYLNRKL